MYINIFIWLIVMWVFAKFVNIYKIESVNGEKTYRWSLLFAVFLFFPIFWLACMGRPINDVPTYISSYQALPSTTKEIFSYISTMESGKGFVILEGIIKFFFGNNVTAFRVIIAAIHSIPLIYVFRKYSEDYWVTVYLFVASACHIGWMMNGIRQFIAVVLIIAAIPLMIEKKYVKLIVVVLIASTIHTSAILMLPVVFLVQGKAWNLKTLMFIGGSIIAMFAFSKNAALADSLLQGTEYAGSIASMQAAGDNGVNPIRVLVSAVPVFLAFLDRKYISQEKNKLIHICVNMSIITVGLNLVAMVTSGILMGRMAIYTSMYSFIIMPYLIKNGFTRSSQVIVNLAMIICYFVYYCFEMGVV